MINQCQGCQAGWPIKEGTTVRIQLKSGSEIGYTSSPAHVVVGGYPNEVVGCTANRYLSALEQAETVDDKEIF